MQVAAAASAIAGVQSAIQVAFPPANGSFPDTCEDAAAYVIQQGKDRTCSQQVPGRTVTSGDRRWVVPPAVSANRDVRTVTVRDCTVWGGALCMSVCF